MDGVPSARAAGTIRQDALAHRRFHGAEPIDAPEPPRDGARDGWSADAKTGLWIFNTRSVGGTKKGFDLWRDFNDSSGSPSGLTAIDEDGAHARMAIMGSIAYSTFDLTASAHLRVRTEADIRRGLEDFVLVILVVSGASLVEQMGRSLRAVPGDILVLFMDRPFKLVKATSGAMKGARLPASDFPPGLRDQSPLLLSPRSSSLAELAATHLLWRSRSDEEREATGDLVKQQLIALLVRGLHIAGRRTDPSLHLSEAAKSMIEAEIGNPNLSAKLLCARLGVSRTSLFEALAASGDTLGNLVRERRLTACRDEMMQASRTETLAAISERWGFRDPSTFTRAFSRRFGRPPTQWSRAMRTMGGASAAEHED